MHKPYSLRRLQGLTAQRQRLAYLKEKMPALVYDAKVGLFFACIYVRQMSLRWLTGGELEEAQAILRETLAEITPLKPSGKNGLKKNIWLLLGQISFDGVCKLQNFLENR